MALIDFTTKSGQTIASTDIADIVNHLQGASGKTDAWHFRVSSGNNYLITLSDAAGAQKFSIRDSAGVEQFAVDSDGTVTATALAPTALTIPTAASPSQTTEGRAVWDSDDDRLTIGTGAATKVIGLSRGAGSDASATQELMYDTTAAQLKVWDGSATKTIGPAVVARNTAEVTRIGNAGDMTLVLTFPAAITQRVRITGQYRRNATEAAAGYFGLKVNATTVCDALVGSALFATSANARAEDGIFVIDIFPGSTNYLGSIISQYSAVISASGASAVSPVLGPPAMAALMPAAPITSITFRSGTAGGTCTLGIQNVVVEVL